MLIGRLGVPGALGPCSPLSQLCPRHLADPPGVLPGQGQDIKYLMSLLCLGCYRDLPRHGSWQSEDFCVPVFEQKVARCEGSHVTLHLRCEEGWAWPASKGVFSCYLLTWLLGFWQRKPEGSTYCIHYEMTRRSKTATSWRASASTRHRLRAPAC